MKWNDRCLQETLHSATGYVDTEVPTGIDVQMALVETQLGVTKKGKPITPGVGSLDVWGRAAFFRQIRGQGLVICRIQIQWPVLTKKLLAADAKRCKERADQKEVLSKTWG